MPHLRGSEARRDTLDGKILSTHAAHGRYDRASLPVDDRPRRREAFSHELGSGVAAGHGVYGALGCKESALKAVEGGGI